MHTPAEGLGGAVDQSRWLQTLRAAIETPLKVILAIALLGELSIVFVNTLMRSFAGTALLWTDETAQIALSTMAFLGGAFAYRRGEHASIRMLVNALPIAGQRMCDVLVDLVVTTMAVVTGWNALPLLTARWEEFTPMLEMRAGWYVVPLIVSMVLLAVTAVERLVSRHRSTALLVGVPYALLAVAVALTRGTWRPWFAGEAALTTGLVLFFCLVLIGLPVAFGLLFGAFVYLYVTGMVPLTALAQNAADGTTNFVLVALPFFIFAGMIMQKGGISLRLVQFVHALVGHFRGGLLQVMVVSMYIVSGLSGAKTADVAAVGSVMRDMLRTQGYSMEQSAAVLAASAIMGETVPPSIAMLVLGSVTTLSVGALFIAGLIPAVVVAACLMALIYVQARRSNAPRVPRATGRQLASASVSGVLPLMMPVILFAGILLGIGTPTEVSSFAVVYGLALAAGYGELRGREFLENVVNCASLSGLILFILAAASSFSWTLSVAQLPQRLVGLLTSVHNDKWLFLFGSIVLLVVIGSILEGLPALLILAPILMPIAGQLGVSLLHYGIILVIAMGIGIFIPPVGIGFYVCCAVCDTTIEKSARAMIPFLIVVCIGLLVVTLVPWFTLLLPAKFNLAG